MKHKYRFAIFFIIMVCTISCNQNKERKENRVIKSRKELSNNKTDNGNEPQQVALKFYKWYLKDIYLKKYVESPGIKLTKDSTYVLDATKHKEFLKSSGYFSSKFYDNEISTFKNCENQLKTVKWKEVEKSGAVNPADFVKSNDCNFTFYMVWTNGQGEILNKAEIEKYSTKGNSSLVTLKLSDSTERAFFSRPEVSMIKEGGKWKISKINVSF